MKKQIICLVLVSIMSLALFSGCGGTPESTPTPAPAPTPTQGSGGVELDRSTPTPPAEEGTKYAEELTIIIDNNKTAVLDPGNPASSTNTTRWAFILIYDRLTEFNNYTGEVDPMLATSWETEDWQNFTFNLRDDVTFHNGEKFTAADVVYTIERAKESLSTNTYDLYNQIESTNIVNDYTIEFKLAQPNVDFLVDLSQPYCGMLNKKAIDADAEQGPWVGTGAYMVSEFVSNEYGVYAVNENYWGEVPITKKLTLKFVAEESTRLMMLENSEVQVACSINPVDFPYLESDPRFATYSYTVNNTAYLAFNMNDPITGDINFRMAVAHAIVRNDMALSGRNGYATLPDSGTFWGFRTEFKNTSLPIIPYDLEKAKEYLAKSSYNGETIEIVSAFSDLTKNAQVAQQNLAEIGVICKIYETDAPGISSHATFADNKAQMICYTGTWNPPASSVRNYYYPGATNNRASYVNDEITALLDSAPSILDPAEREAAYLQIQEIAYEEIPYLSLYNITHVIGALDGVGGLNLSNSAAHDFRYVYMTID